MGTRPLGPGGGQRPGWRIRAPHDAEVQGIVVSGFKDLPYGEALFLCIGQGGVGGRRAAWLAALQEIEPITPASGKDPDPAAIAFTWTGLDMLGLPKEALESFSTPFREGMCQVDRLRRLGDRRDGEWQPTVIEGGPIWSGNTAPRAPVSGPRNPEDEEGAAEEAIPPTSATVHAILLLYDAGQAAVGRRAANVAAVLAPFGVGVVRQLSLDLRLDARNIAREHFGFADGVSQPIPYGEPVALDGGGDAAEDPWHGVPAGEILLGYANAHHEPAPGPLLDVDSGAERFGLMPDGDRQGKLSLGLNGTYMVVRELRQDVAAFWRSLDGQAARINAHDPGREPIDAQWLAERVVGRHPDGRLLCPSGYYATMNDTGFHKDDPHGHGCPPGSHVRRANPRDGLAPDAASAASQLAATNNHRILRRGRKYGPTIADPRVDDGAERGLLFACLNTDIARQFEFVQQTWILNRNFADLFDEADPLIGPRGPFTIRERPLRRIVEVDTFVRLAGGEYFFLPSLSALAYLASL